VGTFVGTSMMLMPIRWGGLGGTLFLLCALEAVMTLAASATGAVGIGGSLSGLAATLRGGAVDAGGGSMGRATGVVGTSTLRTGATVAGGGSNGGVSSTLRVGVASVGSGVVIEGVSGWLSPVRSVVSWWRVAT
jgi:hypothetical protein